MLRFILKRLGHSLLVLFIVSIAVCFMMRLIPGDPILVILGDEYSPETYRQMQRDLGLDRPIVMQYLYWIGNVLQGDFGYSYFTRKPVSTLLAQALPPTLTLVSGTLIVGVLIALPSGILAAVKRNTKWDFLSMAFAIVGYSMPSFWKGILLIWGFAVLLNWFPTMGYAPLSEDFGKGLWYLVLPSITLGTFFAGLVARMTRSSLLEVLDHEYIKAAKAKGVHETALVYKHAMRNAMIPIVTVIGPAIWRAVRRGRVDGNCLFHTRHGAFNHQLDFEPRVSRRPGGGAGWRHLLRRRQPDCRCVVRRSQSQNTS